MTARFLLAASIGPLPPDAARRLASRTGLELALEASGFMLLVSPGTRWLRLGEAGVVIGTLFHRHGLARPITALEGNDIARILASSGKRLLTDFWGGYVALISCPGAARLFRDPSGALPCYVARGEHHVFAGSDIDVLLAAGSSTSIDCTALACHLYAAGLPMRRTVLGGVDELLPGFGADLLDGAVHHPWWSPWDHVDAPPPEEPQDQADGLRRTVFQCVRGWASTSAHVLLSISGGLDSSIVAAALAAGGGPKVTCLTMFSDDAAGDERRYSRELCERLGLPLIEWKYRLEDIDIGAPLGAHLPRPFGRTQSYAYEQAHLHAAREVGADAFVTGNGGDNVFGYSQSASAIADRYLAQGFGAALLSTIGDICRQTGCSALQAVRSAVRILRSPPHYRWRPSDSLLHSDVLAQFATERLYHPWLDGPDGTLPGKAGHIAALLRVQPNLEPGRARYAPVLNPLVSQPVMERCLAIPSWQWRSGGIDRAVARAAFERDLPAPIVSRRAKGGPDGFTAEIVAHYRKEISERLLGGYLAKQRLIDTARIERLLNDKRPTLGVERTRLLALVAAEAWVDHWSARLARIDSGVQAGIEASPNK